MDRQHYRFVPLGNSGQIWPPATLAGEENPGCGQRCEDDVEEMNSTTHKWSQQHMKIGRAGLTIVPVSQHLRFTHAVFNGDASVLATADRAGGVVLYFLQRNKYVRLINSAIGGGVAAEVSAIAFTNRRIEELLVAVRNAVRVFSVNSRDELARLGGAPTGRGQHQHAPGAAHVRVITAVKAGVTRGIVLTLSSDACCVWDVSNWTAVLRVAGDGGSCSGSIVSTAPWQPWSGRLFVDAMFVPASFWLGRSTKARDAASSSGKDERSVAVLSRDGRLSVHEVVTGFGSDEEAFEKFSSVTTTRGRSIPSSYLVDLREQIDDLSHATDEEHIMSSSRFDFVVCDDKYCLAGDQRTLFVFSSSAGTGRTPAPALARLRVYKYPSTAVTQVTLGSMVIQNQPRSVAFLLGDDGRVHVLRLRTLEEIFAFPFSSRSELAAPASAVVAPTVRLSADPGLCRYVSLLKSNGDVRVCDVSFLVAAEKRERRRRAALFDSKKEKPKEAKGKEGKCCQLMQQRTDEDFQTPIPPPRTGDFNRDRGENGFVRSTNVEIGTGRKTIEHDGVDQISTTASGHTSKRSATSEES